MANNVLNSTPFEGWRPAAQVGEVVVKRYDTGQNGTAPLLVGPLGSY